MRGGKSSRRQSDMDHFCTDIWTARSRERSEKDNEEGGIRNSSKPNESEAAPTHHGNILMILTFFSVWRHSNVFFKLLSVAKVNILRLVSHLTKKVHFTKKKVALCPHVKVLKSLLKKWSCNTE